MYPTKEKSRRHIPVLKRRKGHGHTEITPELLDIIRRGEQQIAEGNCVVCKTWEDSKRFLDSL
jgi:hypothetical protein